MWMPLLRSMSVANYCPQEVFALAVKSLTEHFQAAQSHEQVEKGEYSA